MWQAGDRKERRIVHWITREILVFPEDHCDGCGDAHGPVCPKCESQRVREQDDRWQTETDDDIRLSHSAPWKDH